MSGKAFEMGPKNCPTCRCSVDETRSMCESYLTEICLETSGASSRRRIGIVGCIGRFEFESSCHETTTFLLRCSGYLMSLTIRSFALLLHFIIKVKISPSKGGTVL